MDDYGTFSPDELSPMIPSLFTGGNFLTRLFFPLIATYDTEEVYFDRILDDFTPAPLVAQLSPGRVQDGPGYRKETIIPASMKPRNHVKPKQVMSRLPGEAIGGEYSASERAAMVRQWYLNIHQNRIARRREIMSADLLKAGAMTLVGEDYPTSLVDFDRLNTLTKALTLGDRWGETGVSPYDDVDEWCNEVGEASGSAVDVVVFERKAWALFKADPKAQKAIDTTLGQTAAISLGFTEGVPGTPAFKGRDGNVEFYVYNDKYKDDDGNMQPLIPEYGVIAGSRAGVEGSITAGLITHADNDYQEGEFFAHNWVDKDTGAELIETITASMPVPKRINGTHFATVR